MQNELKLNINPNDLQDVESKIERTEYWLGENGIMFAIVTLVFGIYYWRKAIKANL